MHKEEHPKHFKMILAWHLTDELPSRGSNILLHHQYSPLHIFSHQPCVICLDSLQRHLSFIWKEDKNLDGTNTLLANIHKWSLIPCGFCNHNHVSTLWWWWKEVTSCPMFSQNWSQPVRSQNCTGLWCAEKISEDKKNQPSESKQKTKCKGKSWRHFQNQPYF